MTMALTNPKILTAHIHQPDQHLLKGYESRGGYQAIRKTLKMDPDSVIEEVKKSNIKGRGGAGFPTGLKWSFAPKPAKSGKPNYIIQNADESEPGTFMDRLLLERDPHATIEGMIIAAWALQANWGCIYIRGEYAFPYVRIQAAVQECYEKGYLGKNIFGTGFTFDLIVHRGAGAYICGEETALLNSIEGKKGQPRIKPPYFPLAIGLYGNPTLVNNTETYANLPYIMNHGGEHFAKIGVPNSSGTKLWSVSGHVNRPGVYEVEMGFPFMQFLEEYCGGVWKGRKLKGVIPGGSSMPILTADEVKDMTLDFDSIKQAGSMVGSGGMIVMDDTTDMVEVARNLAHFYAHESCGQCTPCREGGHWIEKIFTRISKGQGVATDVAQVTNVANSVEGHTICAFGEALAWPAKAFVKKYEHEFQDLIGTAGKPGSQKRDALNFEVPNSFPIL
jgi:NADH-quinone oxidoreductase subunit F